MHTGLRAGMARTVLAAKGSGNVRQTQSLTDVKSPCQRSRSSPVPSALGAQPIYPPRPLPGWPAPPAAAAATAASGRSPAGGAPTAAPAPPVCCGTCCSRRAGCEVRYLCHCHRSSCNQQPTVRRRRSSSSTRHPHQFQPVSGERLLARAARTHAVCGIELAAIASVAHEWDDYNLAL